MNVHYTCICYCVTAQPQKVYGQAISKTVKIWPPFLDVILKVGQLQLLRKQIAHELNTSLKFDSKFLASALQTVNTGLLADIERHYQDPSLPYPKEENPLMFELTSYLEAAGFHNPLMKIYITTRRLPYFPLFNFLFVVTHLSKLVYSKSINGMVCKKMSDPLDGPPFVVGCITLLKQFHSENTAIFIAYLGEYVRSLVEVLPGAKSTDLSQDILNVLVFLEDYIYYSGLPRKMVEAYIPTYIFDEFRSQFAQ
ncbi:hypothetical protein ScPMuIL_001828 [Solemya velum]